MEFIDEVVGYICPQIFWQLFCLIRDYLAIAPQLVQHYRKIRGIGVVNCIYFNFSDKGLRITLKRWLTSKFSHTSTSCQSCSQSQKSFCSHHNIQVLQGKLWITNPSCWVSNLDGCRVNQKGLMTLFLQTLEFWDLLSSHLLHLFGKVIRDEQTH